MGFVELAFGYPVVTRASVLSSAEGSGGWVRGRKGICTSPAGERWSFGSLRRPLTRVGLVTWVMKLRVRNPERGRRLDDVPAR